MESLSNSVDQEAALKTVCDALSAQKGGSKTSSSAVDRSRRDSRDYSPCHERHGQSAPDEANQSVPPQSKTEGTSTPSTSKKAKPQNTKRVPTADSNDADKVPSVNGHDYRATLRKYGYVEVRVIAKSLQGIVIEAARVNGGHSEYREAANEHCGNGQGRNRRKGGEEDDDEEEETVIIKITNRVLHLNKMSNKHGKSLSVQEDIIKEKKLLMYLTANNPPPSLVRFLGFFSDPFNYYLVCIPI